MNLHCAEVVESGLVMYGAQKSQESSGERPKWKTARTSTTMAITFNHSFHHQYDRPALVDHRARLARAMNNG